MTSKKYAWTNFYIEFADKLLNYKNNRKELLEIINRFYNKDDLKFSSLSYEKGELPEDIDHLQ